jgi:hypothetical protein
VFISTSVGSIVNGKPTNADFMKPTGTGNGATGVNACSSSAPVFDDFWGNARNDGSIDCGAVER